MKYILTVISQVQGVDQSNVFVVDDKQFADFMNSYADKGNWAVVERPDLGDQCATAFKKDEITFLEIRRRDC